MPDAAAHPASPPLRTWRPMAAWSLVLLAAVGLIWFVATIGVPVIQVRLLLRDVRKQGGPLSRAVPLAARLGSPERAAHKVMLYMRLTGCSQDDFAIAWEVLGSYGAGAVPELIRTFRSPNQRLAQLGVYALGSIGRPAVPAMIEELNNPSYDVRLCAADALARMLDDAAVPAVPALIKALGDQQKGVRSNAAFALSQIGPKACEAVPTLVTMLDEPEKRLREDYVHALGNMGPAAAEAIPAIEKLLTDEDQDLRSAAASALKKMRGEEPLR